MKIAHVVSYFSTLWKYQENFLAEEQAIDGHDVHVFTSNLNYPYPDYKTIAEPVLGPRLKRLAIEHTSGYTVHNLEVRFEFSHRVWLKGLMDELVLLQPDVIFCHGITQPHSFQLLYHKALQGIPIIADEHVLLSDIKDSFSRKMFYRVTGFFFRKKMERRVKCYVGISDGVGKLFRELVGLSDLKVQIIPLGTDSRLFKPDPALGTAFRNRHHLPENAIVVGYTGKIGDYKKVHFLIDAAEKLPQFHICILLVGNVFADYAPFLSQKIETSSVKVVCLPAVTGQELPAVYNACDFLAWPAHQTISTVSASSCGKPIICSDFLKERFEKGQGLGVISGDFNSFFTAFRFFVENESERQKMGENGRHWAETEVSWTSIHLKFMRILSVEGEQAC